jgi:hypothetical protein
LKKIEPVEKGKWKIVNELQKKKIRTLKGSQATICIKVGLTWY